MFEKVIQSMRVFRSAKTGNIQIAGASPTGDKFADGGTYIADDTLLDPTQAAATRRKKKDSGSGLIIALVVIGGIGFALSKLKKKKGGSKKG